MHWILSRVGFVAHPAGHAVVRVPSIFSGRVWILKAKMFHWQNVPGYRQKLNPARYRAQTNALSTLPGQIGPAVLEYAVKGKVTVTSQNHLFYSLWNIEWPSKRNIREYRVLDIVGSNFNETCQPKIEKRDCPLDDCYVTMWQVRLFMIMP